MVADEKHINSVLHDANDLDGKNDSLRLQQKTSLYYIYFAIIVITIISLLFVKFAMSTEQDPRENILLILGILLLLYFSWNTISRWISVVETVTKNNLSYDSSSLMYRILN